MKKLLLALTFTALASVPLVHADKASEQDPSGKSHGKKPNIVFILADDLGWTDLSTGETNLGNGSDFYETPNIDALAKSGISFTSAYMQPNCAPTRAALISGQYPARDGNGVYNVVSLNRGKKNGLIPPEQNEDVPASSITVAEAFQTAGYTTAHFGKYHPGGHEGGAATLPLAAGFDINFTGNKQGLPASYHAKNKKGKWAFTTNLSPDLDPYAQPYDKKYIKKHNLASSMLGKPKHLTDALADAFESFVAEHVSPDKKPIYVHYWLYNVHTPISPRSDLAEKFTDKKKQSPSNRGHDNSKYAAMVNHTDQAVGRVLDALDDPDGDGDISDSIRKDTLVIFSSDNGGNRGSTTNSPLRRTKGTFYEGGIRVPMIASRPGTIPSGKISDTMVHAVDYYPTFLEAAGIKRSAEYYLDGQSFAKALVDPATKRKRSPITYHFPGYMDNRAAPTSTILSEINGQRYKLIHYYEDGHNEIYNLSKDLSEKRDLTRVSNNNPEVEQVLMKQLSNWLTQETPGWQPKYPKNRNSGKTLSAPTAK